MELQAWWTPDKHITKKATSPTPVSHKNQQNQISNLGTMITMVLGNRVGLRKRDLMYTLRNKAVFKISVQEYKFYFFALTENTSGISFYIV